MKNGWTGGQYSLFRVVFASYVFVHFATLFRWGPELFSSDGALTPASASPLAHLFPNVLSVYDGPRFVLGLLALGALATLPFALGIFDRAAAVVIWYVWACLFGRNPLIANPSNAQETFVGTIVQFLPQFILIAFLLRLMLKSE